MQCVYNVTKIASSNGIIFRFTGPLWGESTATGGFPSQWPVTRRFGVLHVLSRPEQTAQQTIETPVILDAMVFIMTSL